MVVVVTIVVLVVVEGALQGAEAEEALARARDCGTASNRVWP